ncbi:exodeoxyribonuclease V subunit alpha [Shewanella psychropiezotolerans]|uniref:RecBCD enzyme subunit RecD n=1 Tax=Shewanella psychropiezotolerans TaxID=2593655 RepID=A0ABX5WZY9_9GAMM|nr:MULTISPECIES: exodeoxyribonuclease V subunit alpha [Shewanella]MPY24184.1 exodeoxyribonuclease V subunit alpha [Shewanella sp. YLB-07]QDO84406.1 exodeoxyribonuclease V subunit alpha [Shewanella psychropiezotolerans]
MIQSKQSIKALLKSWETERLITPLDRHFALELAEFHRQQLDQHNESHNELFLLICALLSHQLSQQHTCLPIEQISLNNPMNEQEPQCRITCSHDELMTLLSQFSAIGVPQDSVPQNSLQESSSTPLVLDQGSLYLQRYYQFETQVADKLRYLAQDEVQGLPTATQETLNILFPHNLPKNAATESPVYDWQKIATATAFTKRLAVITGGPGTGKTTTVTKLLFLMTQKADLTIKLVAPTGKAAARLSESIKASKVRLKSELAPFADKIDINSLSRVPEEASTLHRLLGVIPNSPQFRHHKDNPLRLDLLVVDEASMVDLPMMHKLLSALPSHARLILLGDQDQLASVEAGAVLADICAGLKADKSQSEKWQMRYSAAYAQRLSQLTGHDLSGFISASPGIGDSLCMLMHSHRFKGDAGIGQLAGAVNNSDKSRIMEVWQSGYDELHWIEHQKTSTGNAGLEQLLTQSVSHYSAYLEMAKDPQSDPLDIIECYNEFRILCAMRAGEYGVDGINQGVKDALKQAKLISPEHEFYPGRPVIIQSNDYNLGLFNGDIGLILPDSAHQQATGAVPRLMAHFIQADGSILKVLPARLPSHDTCFAMTVHKSQGSEFSKVAMVLPLWPSQAQKQLLTKELVYTAITRAKHQFTCLGSQTVFEQASLQATKRSSGLARRLWN